MEWAPPSYRGSPAAAAFAPPRCHGRHPSYNAGGQGQDDPASRGQHGRLGGDWRPGRDRSLAGAPGGRLEPAAWGPYPGPEEQQQPAATDGAPRPWGYGPPPGLDRPWDPSLQPQQEQKELRPQHYDHPAYPYQDHYPQQGQQRHQLPPHPYQQNPPLDSPQQQYPYRGHPHPFQERAGPPPGIQNVASQSENASCQNQTLPQPGGGLNLPAGYGPQNNQLLNQGHSNQQNFSRLPVDGPPWNNEHGMQYKSEEMPKPWSNVVANFPQGSKDSSLEQPHRIESMTKFLPPEQFSHDFKNTELTKEQDEFWLMRFVSKHRLQPPEIKKSKTRLPLVNEVKESVLGVCKLVAELTVLCQHLKQNVESEDTWTESYQKAIDVKTVLQEKLKALTDSEYISSVKRKLGAIKKKRRNIQRIKQECCLENQEHKARMAEKEAKIDTWRMKRVREVEEKKRERELKAAADSVLSEVRKKQADAKRSVDILRALEKLRKLRKEAAARKGVHPPSSADETFEHHVERLRKLIKIRSDLYDAEERALRVMLEGEQEEERKRENEKKLKKEREKLEKQQREVEFMLFGDSELPPDHPLQPFSQYYMQAEHSSHVLVQIRQEWDRYLVPGDLPDASSIPQGWIFPCPPLSDTWGTALT
ncbi:programmed cell death protein 7 isoform X2 [Rhinoraja longicauda]